MKKTPQRQVPDSVAAVFFLRQFSLTFFHLNPINHQAKEIFRHVPVAKLPVLYGAVGNSKIIGKLSANSITFPPPLLTKRFLPIDRPYGLSPIQSVIFYFAKTAVYTRSSF